MRSTLLFFAVILAASGTLQAGPVLFAATGGEGVLYSVDPQTAAFTEIGPLLTSNGPIGLTGMAYHAPTGVMYGVTGNASPNDARSLVTINTSTAQATLIGSLGANTAADIAFSSNWTLFGWRAGPNWGLGTIDLATGAFTSIADGPSSIGNGLEFGPGGILYLVPGGASGPLVTVDPATGALVVGPTLTGAIYDNSTASTINAMSFDGVNLFGVDSSGDPDRPAFLVTIDSESGAVTNIGALPDGTDALAFGTPEPGSAALMTLGGALLLLLRRRRT